MRDYHVQQFVPRTSCSGKNCAAATTAMDIFFGTRGSGEMTAEQVRRQSGVSCVPGVDTASGGLDIKAIERVCLAHGVDIDFRGRTSTLRRWNETELRARLGTYYGAHMIGDYSKVHAPWRAHGSTFQGNHSLFAHDYRLDLADSHFDKVQPTVCWHDPLRLRPIRVPFSVLLAYNQTTAAIRGLAGFVKIPAIPGSVYADPMTDRTRMAYATLAVHDERTTGLASTVRVIKGKGKLVEVAMYANGETYHRSKEWGALSLLGNEWVHLKRLDHVRGDT